MRHIFSVKYSLVNPLIFLMVFSVMAAGCLDGEKVVQVNSPAEIVKQEIVVGGSGANIPLIKKLAHQYMNKNPGVRITVPDSIGSAGGVSNTASGLIDIGLVSRPLKSEEIHNSLKYVPYCKTVIVFAAHPTVRVAELTKNQIEKIYKREITNWREVGGEDRPIVVLDRESEDSSRTSINQEIPGFRDYDRGPKYGEVITFNTDQAMNEAIYSIENSIGWTDLGAIKTEQPQIRIINLDGIVPGYKSVSEGQYKLVKELAFVIRHDASETAKDFVNFVVSNEARQIMLQYSYIPIL